MIKKHSSIVVLINLFCFLLPACASTVYVSDMKIIHKGDIHGEIGLDKPYWTDQLILCETKYKKGVVIHPEDGRVISFAEFLLPHKGGRLLGTAGWAEQTEADHNGKMRYRFFADDKLLYSGEINGKDCEEINIDLGEAIVLRIETDNGFDQYWDDHMAFGDLRVVY